MNGHELKALKTRRDKAEAEYEAAMAEVKEAQRRASDLRNRKDTLETEIKRAEETSKDPIVTEHALLRFAERVYGVDVEKAREAILSDALKQAINHFRSGSFPIEGYDCTAVVKDRVIVTIKT